MIHYDPGKWNIVFACALRGSVFPKAFVFAFPLALSAIGLHSFLHWYDMRAAAGGVEARVLGQFQTILAFLVVFRSQQAYSRWWEGGTLLQQLRGEWFNSFSCLVAFSNAAPEKRDDVVCFHHQLVRLYSLLYGCALQQVSTLEENTFEIFPLDGMDERSLQFLQDSPDRCEVALQWIQRLIVESDASGALKIAAPILSRVFNELGNGIVNLNNARKITEFPIPFPLAQMMTVMLLFHAAVTPVLCAVTITDRWWCGTVAFLVIFSYWSINYIAVELEMPFGDDLNDLPLREMQEDFNRSLKTLLSVKAQRVPVFKYQPALHDLLQPCVVDFDKDLVSYRRRTELALEDNILLEKQLQKKYDAGDVIGSSAIKNEEKAQAHVSDGREPAARLANHIPQSAAPKAGGPSEPASLSSPQSVLPPINTEQQNTGRHRSSSKQHTTFDELAVDSLLVLCDAGVTPSFCSGTGNTPREGPRFFEESPRLIVGARRAIRTRSRTPDERLRLAADNANEQAQELAKIRMCIEENLSIISREVQEMNRRQIRL